MFECCTFDQTLSGCTVTSVLTLLEAKVLVSLVACYLCDKLLCFLDLSDRAIQIVYKQSLSTMSSSVIQSLLCDLQIRSITQK